MRVNWDYIAGFFDGEGSISTMNFSCRHTLAATMVTLSQTGTEGIVVLSAIRDFLWSLGIKGYLQTQKRREGYRTMHHLKINARPSVTLFLLNILPRISVKRVAVQDALRFIMLFPSIRGPITAERNRERGKYGALNLDRAELQAARAAGVSLTKLAKQHNTKTYTINKYLDPDYRVRYDAYRKRWRAKKAIAIRAASAA